MPSVFQFLLVASYSIIGHHSEESVSTFLTSTSIRNLYTCIRCLWSVTSPGWTMPSLYIAHMLQYLCHLWLFSGFVPLCPSSAYTRNLRTGLRIPYMTSLVLRRGKGSQSQPPPKAMWCCSLCNPGEAICPPCHKGMLWAHCPLGPPEPSLQSCFPTSHQFCFFRLLPFLWMSAQACGSSAIPLSFVSFTNLLKVHPVLWSGSTEKVMKHIGPSISHSITPLVPGLPLDFMLLITTLWAQRFSQFSKLTYISSVC